MLQSLKKGTEDMKEQRTKTQVKKTKTKKQQQQQQKSLEDNTHPLSPFQLAVINKPPPTYPTPLPFVITIQ